jgi:SAM-dependent methyltransferase
MSAVDPDAVTAGRDLGGGALAHVLPLRPGAEVLILGEAPLLARSVARRGADPVSVASSIDEVLPLEDESVGHAMVPWAGTHGVPELVLAEVARVLRPGGGLYFGVSHRWRFVTNPQAWPVARGRRALREAGFHDVEAYGVRYGGFYPRFLVPLEDAGAVRWFLTSMCLPVSLREAVAIAALARTPGSRAALVLFPDLGFLARRAGGAQAC